MLAVSRSFLTTAGAWKGMCLWGFGRHPVEGEKREDSVGLALGREGGQGRPAEATCTSQSGHDLPATSNQICAQPSVNHSKHSQ